MPISEDFRLKAAKEILFRQAHPRHLDESGRIATLAFKSSKEHDFKISVHRESKTSCEAATANHIRSGQLTVGVWGVAVQECNTVGVQAYDDDPRGETPAHAVIDQAPLGTNARNKVATKLAAYARERGRLFEVSSELLTSLSTVTPDSLPQATTEVGTDTATGNPTR